MEYDQQPGLIESHVVKALQSFRKFEGALSKAFESNAVLEGASLNDCRVQMENDFTRFKMWVGNQAAHQSGRTSLDYQLRKAAHLKQQVIYLLKDICESLQAATSLAHDRPPSLEQNQEDGKDGMFQDDDSDSSSPDFNEDEESDFFDLESDSLPSSNLSTHVNDIGEAVDCLLRLSVAIANPAPHERFRKLGVEPEDLSSYEPYDISYVRAEYPHITNTLADALVKFIARRRQFFIYRQAHHEKLTSNKATDTRRTDLIQEDTLSDDKTPQTLDATSASFTFTVTNQATSTLKLPPRPSAAEDGIFECPFCYRMISAKTNTAWEQHVLGDLRPYTCILSECIDSNSDFDRRHDWQSHVLKYHCQSWSCPFKCRGKFFAAADISRHIGEAHLPTVTQQELKLIAGLGERNDPEEIGHSCPLCWYWAKGVTQYVNHVGSHLEQLALHALPRVEIKGLEDDAGRNEHSRSELGVNTKAPLVFSPEPSIARRAHPGPSHEPSSMEEGTFMIDRTRGDVQSSDSHSRVREVRRIPEERMRIAEVRATTTVTPVGPDPALPKDRFVNAPVDQMRHLSFGEERLDIMARRFARYEKKNKDDGDEEEKRLFEFHRSKQRHGVLLPPDADSQLETILTNKADRRDFWKEDTKGASIDGPVDEQKTRSKGKARDWGTRPSIAWPQREEKKWKKWLPSRAERHDSWEGDSKVKPPVATPEVPAYEQEMKKKGKVPQEAESSRFVAQPQRRIVIGKNQESNEGLPTDFPSYSMSTHLQPTMHGQRYTVPGPILSSADYPAYSGPVNPKPEWDDSPSCSVPATLPPTGYSGYYVPAHLQDHPWAQDIGEGSSGGAPVYCTLRECTAGPFRRYVDLERHTRYTHSNELSGYVYRCDYRNCTRSYELFHRRDYFRYHLREYHDEDISKYEASSDMGSGATTWWRCPRCLTRVYVSENGYECPDCKKSKSEGKRPS
ncbi:transcription factor [Fusarium flagelliforme]|uniref:Transcription factor n=1 Tax=Fusarium flagelliforme TaxID=2675880 RepID=A0A395MEH1_9HYPO|nr:transcription factor [Fusarium flagelliforme]